MNALNKPVTVKVFGNHISFNPRQIKSITNQNMADKMHMDLGYEGLIGFPEEAMELDRNSIEFKAIVEEKVKEGTNKRIDFLNQVASNLRVSLQRDLDAANIKTDAGVYASKGELAVLKELASYADLEAAEEAKRSKEYKELVNKVDLATKKG